MDMVKIITELLARYDANTALTLDILARLVTVQANNLEVAKALRVIADSFEIVHAAVVSGSIPVAAIMEKPGN